MARNLYSHIKGSEAIRETVEGIGDWSDNAGNLEPLDGIFPDGVAPGARATFGDGRKLLKTRSA